MGVLSDGLSRSVDCQTDSTLPPLCSSILPPHNDQDRLLVLIWELFSVPAGLLTEGVQSDQAVAAN